MNIRKKLIAFIICIGLTSSCQTGCIKEVDNLFTAMNYGLPTTIAGLSSALCLADYICLSRKIENTKSISQNFDPIKDAVYELHEKSSCETIKSINQQFQQFESDFLYIVGSTEQYTVLKQQWEKVYLLYRIDNTSHEPAQQLRKEHIKLLKNQVHAFDEELQMSINRLYESSGSTIVYAGVAAAACLAIATKWYYECAMNELKSEPFSFLCF